MLSKITVEATLNAELDQHLGYGWHQSSDNANSHNGYTAKTVKTEDGQFELNAPRDSEGSFEPRLVKKGQTRFTSMDDKILSLYAKGMTTREIVATFKEMYDADISPTLISKVTEAVIDKVDECHRAGSLAGTGAVCPAASLARPSASVKVFPTDESARKVIYLAIMNASKKWTMPIRNRKLALNRFIIEFEDRISDSV